MIEKRKVGRPQLTRERIPREFMKHYKVYKQGKLNISQLARVSGFSRPSVYRYIRLLEVKE